MSYRELSGEKVAYAVMRVVVSKGADHAFNYLEVCDQIFGGGFCNEKRGNRVAAFLGGAVSRGDLKRVASPQGEYHVLQHYMVVLNQPETVRKDRLLTIDPSRSNE